MSEKRVQIVEIGKENINDFFRGNMTVIEGLPDDASLVRTWDEPARQTFCFMFESEAFPKVEEGEEPPRADIVVAQRRVDTSTHWLCPNCTSVFDNGDMGST